MSIELMESFIMFGRGSYSRSAAATTLTAVTTPLAWSPNAWQTLVAGTIASVAPTAYVDIVADPVFPARNRMRAQASVNHSSYSASWVLRRASAYTGVRRMGFLLNMISSAYAVSAGVDPGTATAVAASHPASINWLSLVSFYKAAASTVINISHGGTGVATSLSYTLSAGIDYYVELEVDTDAGTYRVWVDDYLIIDAAMSAAAKTAYAATLALRFTCDKGVTVARPVAYISDIYLLKDDGIAPNTRLGKNTRVKGELPTADVRSDFTRPSAYSSNWDVADNQLAVTTPPTDYLTAGVVGARDLYTSDTDASYANAIHGVSVKAVIANFASQASTPSAVLYDGTNSAVVAFGSIAAGSSFAGYDAKFTTGPGDAALSPASVASMSFGMEVTS